MSAEGLALWTIYRTEGPRHFTVRRCVASASGVKHDGTALHVDSLDLARAAIPLGLARQPRHPLDDASIVEVWL